MQKILSTFCLITITSLLSSCANMKEFQQNMDSMVGKLTYDQAVQSWGPPAAETKLTNGGRVVKWNWTQDYTAPSYTTVNPNPYMPSATTTGGGTHRLNEQLLLTFNKSNIMVSWSWSRQ